MRNKEVKTLITRIISNIILTIAISFIWLETIDKNNLQKQQLLAMNNLVVSEFNNNNNYLYQINDTEIDNLDKNTINIKNTTNNLINCDLLIRIDKKSTLNPKYLKYEFAEKINSLNDLEYEDNTYYYYNLGNIDINPNTDLTNQFVMWLDENSNDIENKTLSYKIIAKENNSLVLN